MIGSRTSLHAVRSAACLCLLILHGPSLAAQQNLSAAVDLLFYGDNTEFRNPFREGETIFGTAVRVAAEADVGDRVTIAIGAFGNLRFGGDDAFELVRPVVSLSVRGRRSVFLMGTLPLPGTGPQTGPDRGGPHRLLPPLQRETLTFDRPYEAGLQWTFSGSTLRHEMWLNWQRVNTPEHRERFDAGLNGETRLGGPFVVPMQFHVVHEGGQLFASGPVRDSLAAATGLILRGRAGGLDDAAIEVFALGSRFVPDRSRPERTRAGAGFFSRASAERSVWRAHVIFWRGNDYVKDEGDPNYLSVRRDGTRYRNTRDYAEAGLALTFRPAPGVSIAAAARLHRIEGHYEYSYRVTGAAALRWPPK